MMRRGVQLMATMLINGVGNQQQIAQIYGQRDRYMDKEYYSYIPFEEVEIKDDVTLRPTEFNKQDESDVGHQTNQPDSTETVLQVENDALS
jgi:hypothetical protein|tara:strand:- start:142 stop:414 length:273 start_codon:yes stop_codon:yes gene_type:complete